MTRRDAYDLALAAVSLTALVTRVVALAWADLDRSLRDWRVDPVPPVVPTWVDEWSDL